MSASCVANVLSEAIETAESFGLAPGHRPKIFRPTGATEAVRRGVDVDTVQQLGRWKTRSVFLEHCVHSEVPDSFTSNMLQRYGCVRALSGTIRSCADCFSPWDCI